MTGCSCGHPDCHGEHSLYLLTKRTWNNIATNLNSPNVTTAPMFSREIDLLGDGHIHPRCAERILGRQLVANDFIDRDVLNAEKDLGRQIPNKRTFWR